MHPFVNAILLGWPGWMRIGVIPNSIHQRESCVIPPSENAPQNGVPLSLII